ncbi:MAG: esterase [Leptospiraceae bacterium]|nr:esterase [Leptospiraceae bacterium]MCP5497542.1 esterase [Leptospiraceae bacterium]
MTEGEKGGPVIILLHGYGANAMDLAGFHELVKCKKGTTWIFPDGIMEVPIAFNYVGRAWFDILSTALERFSLEGNGIEFSDITPTGLQEARLKIEEMIDKLNVPFETITIGGFSQGAMLATEVTLRQNANPAGLVILSGTLIHKNIWEELAKTKSDIQFFMSHGTDDPLLPYNGAKKLESLFRNSGMSGEFVSFNGGHEIPDKVVARLGEYLIR